jgi:iron complex outermembrane recepter protein
MQGGDFQYGSSAMLGTNTFVPGEERTSGFGRFSYELAGGVNAFLQASYARYEGLSRTTSAPPSARRSTRPAS